MGKSIIWIKSLLIQLNNKKKRYKANRQRIYAINWKGINGKIW